MFYLRTLGGLSLEQPDAPDGRDRLAGSKSLLILAVLATTPDHAARRDHLAQLLWPEFDRPRALRALRQALFYLSRHADEILIKDDDTLRLDPSRFLVDVWELERALHGEDYARAIELFRGPFAAGVERKVGAEAEHWIEAENARVTAAIELAYSKEIARALADEDASRAVRLARSYAALNPLDERGQRTLIRTLRMTGDEVGAVASFEAYRKLVEQELGETPPAELGTSVARIRDELHRGVEPLPGAATAGRLARDRSAGSTTAARPLDRRLAIWGGVAVVALVALIGVALGTRDPTGSLTAVDARLLATVQRGNGSEVVEVTLGSGGVATTPIRDLATGDLPSPDGRSVAYTEQASDGWNLAVRSSPSAILSLTTAPGDEFPLAWSPDGRHLVYAHRRLLPDGRGHAHAIAVYDLAADSSRRLTSLESTDLPTAAWSPDGTRIAFTADMRRAPDVFLVDFDGANLTSLAPHRERDEAPAWSPNGERLVFVSRRSGAVDLYTTRADGTDLRAVTQTAAVERDPVWISPTVVAFVVQHEDGEGDFWALDTFTGQAHQLTRRARFGRVVARRPQSQRWIERVAIVPRVGVGSPGQHLSLRLEVTDGKGEPLQVEGLPLRWYTTDDQVARVHEAGQVDVVGPGRTAVIASAAGWRADTLILYAIPLTAVAVPPVLREDWAHGLDAGRWRAFGDPPPYTRPTGGPSGSGVFLNNGDAFFASGAVSRQAFPAAAGVTVEVDARMPFTGQLHQEFGLALYDQDHADSLLASGAAKPVVALRIRGPSGADPPQAWVVTGERRDAVPVPRRLTAWRRYALQLLPNGVVDLIIDGRMHWRSAQPLEARPAAVRIGLGDQSLATEIAHGALEVYIAPKYRLPELPGEGARE